MTSNKKGLFSNLKSDFPASIVVFLVALPLCLGIALASDAPLFSGIIAGIVGGTVVALISKSSLGVSGPAAGLVIIVSEAITDLGTFEVFLLAVVIAGAFQIILGVIKAGIIGYYFPVAVIKGMLAGIGISIFFKQIPHAVGYQKDPEGDLAFSQVDGENTISELFNMVDYINPGAIIIALISLGILILWERPFMKKIALFGILQGALVVVLLGIGLNLVFADISFLRLTPEQTVNIPVAKDLGQFVDQFTLPDFSKIFEGAVWFIAAKIAVVASLETLLCVEATDKLDPEKNITPTNRELVAQGAGNMVSGLIGGLPITQVIVRSSANIQSGGKTKAAAFFHGILLLVSAITIPTALNLIPYSSLAAILLVVGFKLAKPSLFKEMYRLGVSQFIPFIVTILGIYFGDLLIGIGLGLVVAIFHILYKNYKVPFYFDPKDYKKGKPVVIQLSEHVTFLNKASILKTLNQIPDGTDVIIDATAAKSIHPDVKEIVHDFEDNAKTRNINVQKIAFDDDTTDHVKQFNEAMQGD
jgi:MFS superfamily sulfate permease-like transporter